MKLLTILAATAAAAAVAAAISIPASADRSGGEDATKLATCLHAHGATATPSGEDPMALKQWVGATPDDAAVKACVPGVVAPTELMSCLRAHGLNPPDNLFDLKPWMARQAGTDAGKAALSACGMDFNPPERTPAGKDLATCLRSHGADVPAGADGLALKSWISRHSGDANAMDALKLCGAGAPMKADCGGGAAAPAPKPDGGAAPKESPVL
jgi:hypothetical protein